jgi:tetratricopeptide (TPR) repeat protein
LGLALLGLGLGYNSWGWGGYGYPYGYAYGNQWGYGGWLNSGYYYNPYYSTSLTLGPTVIDYSQPLYSVAVEDSGTTDEDPNTTAAMADFDAARGAFRQGDYNAALDGVHRALERLPNDAALHEFRALVLFAQGNYREAAATLHAVLANGPGWDWATMSALYPGVNVYTDQLRALEDYTRSNPDSADAQFVLGYHYMTEGYQDAGIRKFQRVVQLEPKDQLAQRIVESSLPESSTTTSTTEPAPNAGPRTPNVPEPPATSSTTNAGTPVNVEGLRGDWSATQEDGSKFNLSLGADNQFTWQFQQGEESSTMQGTYSASNDLLILEPESGPPMIGRVADAGANGFQFRMVGTPEEDQGLQFSK